MCINEPKEKAQLAVPGNANVWTDAKRIHVQTVVHIRNNYAVCQIPKMVDTSTGMKM